MARLLVCCVLMSAALLVPPGCGFAPAPAPLPPPWNPGEQPPPGGQDGGVLPDGGSIGAEPDAGTEMPVADAGTQTTPRPRFEEFIRSDRYPRMVLEVDSVEGLAPRTSSSAGVVAALAGLLDKPDGIEVLHDQTLPASPSGHAWTFAALDALAKAQFDLSVPAGTIKMHVLFVDGHWADDTSNSKVLGIAWGYRHLVMFKETIETHCRGGLTGILSEQVCQKAEQGVWLHETGHLLGLVDNGLPMVHDHRDPDPAHGAHDENPDCVMYWAWNSGAIFEELRLRLTGGQDPKLEFDAACQQDVAAVRDRASP